MNQRQHDTPSKTCPPTASQNYLEQRILILAPSENDARLTSEFLRSVGLTSHLCKDMADVCAEMSKGCGATLVAEESLGTRSVSLLLKTLAQQPKWSDLPVSIITSGDEASQTRLRRLAILAPGGNVTLLERPFRPETLISTLQVALRSRRRQYEVRDMVRSMDQLMREKESQAQLFDTTLSSIADLAYTFDLEGNWIYANKPLLKLWGKTLPEIVGKSSLELGYPRDLAERLKRQVKEVISSGKPFKGETYFTDAAGMEDYHEYIFSPVFAADGSVTAVTGTTRLTTDRKRAEAVADSQRRVLQLMAEDKPLSEVLEALMRSVELQCPIPSRASVLMLEADGVRLRHTSAPAVPSAFRQAIDGQDLRAAFGLGMGDDTPRHSRQVRVIDLTTDPEWRNYREVSLANDLRQCWSIPITSRQDKILGVLAIYHSVPLQISERDRQMMESAARTASIAIDRKLSDAAIRESQQRYSQLFHGLPTAVYTTDAKGQVVLYNEAAVHLWGRKPEGDKDLWCGSHRMYRTNGEPVPRDLCPMALAVKDHQPIQREEIIIERPDGTRRTVLPFPDRIHDADGRVVGMVNMLLDITESKRAEEVSRRLAAIVESSADAILSKDLNGIITSWNRGAERLLGYTAEEVLGRPVTLLMPPDQAREEPGILKRIRRGERLENVNTIRRRKDGSDVEVSLTVSPLMDSRGTIIGASKILRDITDQKQAERKLELAHKEAVAACRAKDDFLAALSHELRTPLNPVLLLASEEAENPHLPSDIRLQFETIRNNVELEARLIDDLLDINSITHGKLQLNLAAVDVHDILNKAVSAVQSNIYRKNIQLSLQLTAQNPRVRGDAVRLQQVFWNVLKNAAKFTPDQGAISILSETDNASDTVTVTITDNGIGMTRSELDRVFDAFAQGDHLDTPGSHRFGGLGLGLAISRRLMEAHAGTIQAVSQGRGCGSSFMVTLPTVKDSPLPHLDVQPKAGTVPVRKKSSTAVSVLLVEDHLPTRAALAQLLERRHYHVKTAASVAEARSLSRQHHFQVLISDIGLPDGNGLQLMEELRASNQHLQGIALTGYGMDQDIQRTLDAGFRFHLTKPIRAQSLDAALSAVKA